MANALTSILALASLSCFAYCAIGVLSVPTTDPTTSDVNDEDSLFDCKQYRLMFNKQYDSHDEEMSRCVYLLATALKVFTSGVAYRYRKQDHYLALNTFSDWSPQELDMMTNKALDGEVRIVQQDKPKKADSNQQMDPAEVVKELKAKIKTILEENNRKELLTNDKRRKKRDVGYSTSNKQQKLQPRHVSVNMLIKRQKPEPNRDQYLKKVVKRPMVGNENYVELQMEPKTQGLTDGQEQVGAWKFSETPIDVLVLGMSRAFAALTSSLSQIELPKLIPNDQDNKENGPKIEMFADLRETGCFFPVRNQKRCGSCYAFALISVMEYHYCKDEGYLTPFSEQYMVDCGKKLVEGMAGCRGASGFSAANFIHNYGIELETNSPYMGRETVCPYNNETNRETTGYIRFDMGDLVAIPVKYWHEQLKHRPLQVVIAANEGFSSYGGGVYDGKQCTKPNHAMVVVGHGREDGQEFWLLRNSHGSNWGENGYFKLAKSAPEICIDHQQGFVFGTRDGRVFNKRLRKNDLNDDTVLRKLKLLAAKRRN